MRELYCLFTSSESNSRRSAALCRLRRFYRTPQCRVLPNGRSLHADAGVMKCDVTRCRELLMRMTINGEVGGPALPAGRCFCRQTQPKKAELVRRRPHIIQRSGRTRGLTICCIRCSGDCINHCYITQSDQQGRKLGTHRVRIR